MWIFLVFFDMEVAVRAIVLNIAPVLVCTIMPMVGIFIVEMRYKISKQPYLTRTQQATVMVGRLVGGLAIVYLMKLMWLSALQTNVPAAVEAVAAVVNATVSAAAEASGPAVEVIVDAAKEL